MDRIARSYRLPGRRRLSTWKNTLFCQLRWLLLLLVFYAAPGSELTAQYNLYFEALKGEGLLTTVIRSLAYAPGSYLYVGTNDGLYRYDGFRFVRYANSGSSASVCPIINVRALLDDGEQLWVGGVEGLARLDKTQETFGAVALDKTVQSSAAPEVRFLERLPSGHLIAGMEGRFARSTDGGIHWQIYTLPINRAGKSRTFVQVAQELSDGTLLIGAQPGGLWLFNPTKQTWKPLQELPALAASGFPNIGVRHLAAFHPASYLLSTEQGLLKLNQDLSDWEWISLYKEEKRREPAIREILSVPGSEDWLVLTESEGLLVYSARTGTSTAYTYDKNWENGLPDNTLNDGCSNGDGLFWLATENSGLVQVNAGLRAISYYRLPGISRQNTNLTLTAMVQQGDDWWMSTSEGLIKKTKTGNWALFQPADQPDDAYLFNLRPLDANRMLYQHWSKGVGAFDYGSNQFGYLDFPGKPMPAAEPRFDWLSYTDKKGYHYLAGIDGNYYRCQYAPEQWDTLWTVEEMDLPLPTAIPFNESEILLLSSSRVYLYNWKNNKLEPLLEDGNGNRFPPVSFQEDVLVRSNGTICFASDNGFYVYNRNSHSLRRYTTQDGLLVENCFSLTELPDGRMLILTELGVVWFDEAREHFKLGYLPQLAAASATPYTDASGYFYYLGDNGYLKVHTDSLFSGSSGQDLVLEPVQSGRQSLRKKEDKPLRRIRRTDFPLVFAYRLLNFNDPKTYALEYQLEGWDESWQEDKLRNLRAAYPRLTPGEYTFRLRTRDALNRNNQELTYAFTVFPPFWQSAWFILGVFLLSLGLSYLIYRYRLSQIRKIQEMRNRIAGDLHDDIGSTLSSIRMYSEIISQQLGDRSPDSLPLLQRMSSSARETIENMSDIVWTIKPSNDAFTHLLEKIQSTGSERCSAHNINFVMDVRGEPDAWKIPMDARRDLYLIFKEALNNALKYAEPSRFSVEITRSGRALQWRISDNGKGFDLETIRKGNGLDNMRLRAEKRGWTFNLNSSPGSGTDLLIQIPLPRLG